VLPCVPRFQTCLLVREGFGIAMCLVAPGSPPDRGGLWCCHVSHGSRPASQCGRVLPSSRATWHSACYGPQAKGKYSAGLLTRFGPPASEACPCVLKAPNIRLIMTSPVTRSRRRIKCIQDSHTRCMGSIKYVQDIDTARRRQYGAGLLVTHNVQATLQGDSMVLCSKAATVSDDPSTQCHTVHGCDVAEQHDMAFNRSSTTSLATPS
jgi:hypothetical protein